MRQMLKSGREAKMPLAIAIVTQGVFSYHFLQKMLFLILMCLYKASYRYIHVLILIYCSNHNEMLCNYSNTLMHHSVVPSPEMGKLLL